MMGKLNAPLLSEVKIEDEFWSPYISLVQNIMIPYQWKILNDEVENAAPSHSIENYRIAAKESEGEYYGAVFQDTDLAKWLEAAAYSLSLRPDEELEKQADDAIELIGRAQQADGYLDTYYTIKERQNRWTNLYEGHELYTAGHLIEAAVAYYEATGKRKLLDIMCRTADLICRLFGRNEGQMDGVPGHPEIELALVRLYYATQEERYLEQAKYFIDARGSSPNYFARELENPSFHHIFPEFAHLGYNNVQAHMPVRSQKTADGHAVRALYLYSSMADVGYECQDETLIEACRELFDNIAQRQMFITGSVGAAADGECFTCDYDLPNNYNYSETCASVALALFSLRMMQIERNGKYADVFERALYNTVLGGMALSGKEFFYVNPLETVPEHLQANRTLHHVLPERRPWLGVACCPPNIARTLTSLAKYIYAVDDSAVYINLFVSNKAELKLGNKTVDLQMKTRYPYEDEVIIKIGNPQDAAFALAIREPGWGRIRSLIINGSSSKPKRRDGYIMIDTLPSSDSTIQVSFDMEPVFVRAHPRVRADVGKLAIARGPLVYCLEEADNGKNLGSLMVSAKTALKAEFDPALLNGTVVITADAERLTEEEWDGKLYRYGLSENRTVPYKIRAIPYCLWNNRGIGEMLVWIHQK